MASMVSSVTSPSIGIPSFMKEYAPTPIPEILKDELDTINAIYGDGTITIMSAYNGMVTTQLNLPESKLPALRVAFPANYPNQQPDVLSFAPDPRQRTRQLRIARLIVLAIIQSEFIPGNECIFNILDTCMPILSHIKGDGWLDIREAASSIPGFIADQWNWTVSENVDVKDIKAKAECTICYDEFLAFKMISLPCKHYFCQECFQTGWAVSIKSKEPFTCCRRRIALEIIEVFNASRTVEIRQYIRMLQEKDTNLPFYCGILSCSALLGTSKSLRLTSREVLTNGVLCSRCQAYTCSKCRAPWHGGGQCHYGAEMNMLMDEDVFRRCPRCGQGIQKDGGCAHMHCTSCGTHFQWEANGANRAWS